MRHDEEFYRRWALAWRLLAGLSFVVVGAAVLLGMPAGWGISSRFWLWFGGLAAWYVVSILLGRQRLYDSLPLSLLYFAVGWALWAPLLALHPSAYAFAMIFFPLVYSSLPTPRAIGCGLVTMGLMSVHGSAFEFSATPGTLLATLLGAAGSVTLALFIAAIIRQSEERQRLIVQLEAARAGQAEAERQAGILEERQRLAQQIHDTVAQGFVGIVTHLEAAETSLDGAAAAARHIAAAKGSAREALDEARRLVWELRPDLVGGEPLPAALARLLGDWSAKSGVATDQVVTGTARPLDRERETALLQAAREALNNVRAHAQASRVRLTLSYMEDEVVLDVHDDGVGRSSAAVGQSGGGAGGGFGLRALEQRVSALGGRSALEGAAGEGSTLTVSLPLGGLASSP